MSHESLPDRRLTEAQELALGSICARYEVEYDPSHYRHTFDLPEGYVAGWVGGPQHANPDYQLPGEPVGKPTIYVGCDPEGRLSS